MLTDEIFRDVVRRANLAPSIHNAQPSRWRIQGDHIEIAADSSVMLPQADPEGAGIALSVGAAVEATVLALRHHGIAAQVTTHWADDDRHSWPGHRMAARLSLASDDAKDVAAQLEARHTWRGAFADEVPQLFGWSRDDTRLVMDEAGRTLIANLNDAASLGILRDTAFRKELLSWMRLAPRHPRYLYDGLSDMALGLRKGDAKRVRLGFGPLWSLLDVTGRAAALTAEAPLTMTAPVIALFHAKKGACPVATGRAYLRMLLDATNLGFAAWPMAALTDDPAARAQMVDQFPIGPDRQLWQVLRIGKPMGPMPTKARRPIKEVAL